jgi:hypothetical protein
MELTPEVFKIMFPEFRETPDVMIELAILQAKPYINPDAYGDLTLQAWANLAAVFLEGMTQTSGADGSGNGDGSGTLPVTEQTAGKVSIKYGFNNNGTVGASLSDEWLAQSVYGQRYLFAREQVSVGAMVICPGGMPCEWESGTKGPLR